MPNNTGKKYGGRVKGTPNKTTKEMREAIRKVVESNVDNIDDWIQEIAKKNPQKAVELLIKLLDYLLPKINKVSYIDTIKRKSQFDLIEDSTIFDNEIKS